MVAFSNKVVTFGGTDEYITMGDVLGFERTDSFSISFWAKPTGVSVGVPIAKMDQVSAIRGWAVYLDTGVTLALYNDYVGNNRLQCWADGPFADLAWHHVVICYPGDSVAANVQFYIDGSLAATVVDFDTLTASIVSAAPLTLGRRSTVTPWYYNGCLDEVAIYNRMLTATEAAWIYNAGAPRDLSLTAAPLGLVAWWRMGEWVSTSPLLILDSGPSAVPNTVRDLGGSNYTGTMTSMEAADVVFDAPGRGQCAYFDGSSHEMQIAYGGGVKAYERTDKFSVSFWVKLPASGGGVVCSKAGVANQGWWASASPTACSLILNNTWTTNTIAVNTSGVTLNTRWNHVVLTYNGSSSASGVKMYVNGAAVSTSIGYDNLTASIIYSATDVFKIGVVGTSYFTGRMKDLAIWDKELTAAEAAWIYNGGQPRELTSSGSPEGLAGWWRLGNGDKFQEFYDSGPAVNPNNVVDNSLNNNLGTMTNMEAGDVVYDAPGRGKSVLFDGVDEYVTMGDVLGFERTSAQSYSFWVKTTASSARMILTKSTGSTTYRGPSIYLSNGSLTFMLSNDAAGGNRVQLGTTATFNDGLWHHVAITYDGSSTAMGCKIYVDTVLQAVTVFVDALSATILNSSPFMLATRSPLDAFYEGHLDEVAVYDKELSASEVTWIYNAGVPRLLTDSGCPSNLQAWWRMGDGDTAPTLLDQTANNFDGTMTNMESTDIVSCSPGGGFAQKSLLFDGVNEYVSMGNVLGFERTSRFSISFWMKRTGDGSQDVVISKVGAGPTPGWFVWVSNTTIDFSLLNTWTTNQLYAYAGSVTPSNGEWHHVAITYPGDSVAANVKIYLDGVLLPTISYYNTLSSTIVNSANLLIGTGWDTGTQSYLGNLSDVALYGRDLTAAEVAWVYNSGVPRDLKNTPGAPLSLVGWWRLGGSAYRSSSATGSWQTRILGDGPGLTSDFATKCLSFDGGSEYVDFGNVCAFERTQAFSISCWARWVSTDYGALVAKCDGSYTGYILYKYGGGLVWEFRGADASTFSQYCTVDPGNGAWHHIVATYDGSSSKTGTHIFIDGVERIYGGTGTLTGSIVTTAALRIGQRASDLSLTGNVDEVAIYDKQLSQAEVTWIFNSGVPRDLRQLGTPSNLYSWWRMGEGAYVGTMTNMEAGDLTDESLAGYDGIYGDLIDFTGEYGGFDGLAATWGGGGSTVVTHYKLRVRDDGAGPPAVYREWESTDFNSAVPAPPPIGSWVERAVLAEWTV